MRPGRLFSSNWARGIRGIVFFAGFFFYIWLFVDTRLIYHTGGIITYFPEFLKGMNFFSQFTDEAGGLIEYVSAFLSQLFYYSWAGAAVVTAQAVLLFVVSDAFLKSINARKLGPLSYIPCIILLMAYTRYTYHFTTVMVALVAISCGLLYVKLSQKTKWSGPVCFILLSIPLYYVIAAGYLFFAGLCVIYEILFARRPYRGIGYAAIAAGVTWLVGNLYFQMPGGDAFTELLPISWKMLDDSSIHRGIHFVYGIYLWLPGAAILGWIAAVLFSGVNVRRRSNSKTSRPHPILRWSLGTAILLIVSVAACFVSYSPRYRAIMEVDFHNFHRNWQKLLQAAKKYPFQHHHTIMKVDFSNFHGNWQELLQAVKIDPFEYYVIHAVDRALYHTGRLSDDLFEYPQLSDALFLTISSPVANWEKLELYMDLGQFNMAEYMLFEALERSGPRPVLLKRLATLNMVKDRNGAAGIYLHSLEKTLWHDEWACKYLAKLEENPRPISDSRIRSLRSKMPEQDYIYTSFLDDQLFSSLLESNRENKMAFEYQMTLYLLTGKLDKFVDNLKKLRHLGYSKVPRPWYEAILINYARTGRNIVLPGYGPDNEAIKRFRRFMKIYNSYGGNKSAARKDLRQDFQDSYMFYYAFGFSGNIK